jgi:hypothetical protein
MMAYLLTRYFILWLYLPCNELAFAINENLVVNVDYNYFVKLKIAIEKLHFS